MSAIEQAAASVLFHSSPIDPDTKVIRGPNLDAPIDLQSLLKSYETIGFQATSLAKAIQIVNKMVGPFPASLSPDSYTRDFFY
jgi:deoxyhypusine synthase